MRDFLRQFFLYSRAERRGVIALVVLIVLVIIAPRLYHYYGSRPLASYADSVPARELSILQKPARSEDEDDPGIADAARGELFPFDPNTIDAKEWQRLGLSEKQAAVIEKYKKSGGRFRHPDDLRKIYVMSDEMKDRLVPYVRISGTEAADDPMQNVSIEVNAADSAAFEELYGIGPYRAARIVKYRTQLGGFYSIDQIAEVHGLPDSVFRSIRPHLKVNPALISSIDLNEADYELLQKHPYIHAKIAHAIMGYRNYNGKFESLDQLKTLKPVTDDVYERIRHYLRVK